MYRLIEQLLQPYTLLIWRSALDWRRSGSGGRSRDAGCAWGACRSFSSSAAGIPVIATAGIGDWMTGSPTVRIRWA